MGTTLPCLRLPDWLTDICFNRIDSIVVPWQGEVPALVSVVAGGDREWTSHTYDHRVTLPSASSIDGQGQAFIPLPMVP